MLLDDNDRACHDAEERVESSCLVSTLGMFIIDTFRFENAQTGQDEGDRGMGEQIGGGGTYFALGARAWLTPDKILMTIDRGDDFSEVMQKALDTYARATTKVVRQKQQHALWRFRQRSGQPTTRAVNIYRAEHRAFAYLTPKLRLDPIDLLDDNHTCLPFFVHCICSPDRVMDICAQIDALQAAWPSVGGQARRPRIVWEPIPDSAVHANLETTIIAASQVDVLSPNHEEVTSLLGMTLSTGEQNPHGTRSEVEAADDLLRDHIVKRDGKGASPIICIRSGGMGAFVSMPSSSRQRAWVSAYHNEGEASTRIIDVTGAGNAWLGGFTAGLATAPDECTFEEVMKAAKMGSVSASFAVEQLGLPNLVHRRAEDDLQEELWNGDKPSDRLARLTDIAR